MAMAATLAATVSTLAAAARGDGGDAGSGRWARERREKGGREAATMSLRTGSSNRVGSERERGAGKKEGKAEAAVVLAMFGDRGGGRGGRGGEGGGVTVAAATKNREEKAGDGGEVKRKGEGVEVRRGRSVAFGGQKGEAEKGGEGRWRWRGRGRRSEKERKEAAGKTPVAARISSEGHGCSGDRERRSRRGRWRSEAMRRGRAERRGKKMTKRRGRRRAGEVGRRARRRKERRGGKKALGAVLHRARLRAPGRCAPRVVARAHVAVSGRTHFFFFYQDVT